MGRRTLVVIAFGALAAAAAASCSSFEEDPSPGTDGGEDAGGDTATDAATDSNVAKDREASTPVAPTVLATIPGATAIVVDKNDVFVGRAAGGIIRVSLLDADAGTSALTTRPRALGAIAVAGSTVFWVDPVNKDRGRVSVTGGDDYNREEGIALFALATVNTSSVVALQTGVPQNEVREYNPVTVDTATPYGTYASLGDVAAGGARIYWTEPAAGKVYRATVGATSSAVALTSSESGCGSIAADDVGAYWSTPAGLRFIKHTDMTLVGKPFANDGNATSLAAENGKVYWLTKGANGSLRRLDVDAAETPPETLARDLLVNFTADVQAIALTPAYVVWITSDGRVLRLDR